MSLASSDTSSNIFLSNQPLPVLPCMSSFDNLTALRSIELPQINLCIGCQPFPLLNHSSHLSVWLIPSGCEFLFIMSLSPLSVSLSLSLSLPLCVRHWQRPLHHVLDLHNQWIQRHRLLHISTHFFGSTPLTGPPDAFMWWGQVFLVWSYCINANLSTAWQYGWAVVPWVWPFATCPVRPRCYVDYHEDLGRVFLNSTGIHLFKLLRWCITIII